MTDTPSDRPGVINDRSVVPVVAELMGKPFHATVVWFEADPLSRMPERAP